MEPNEEKRKNSKRNFRKMDRKINCLCIVSVIMLTVMIYYGYNIYEIRQAQLQEENLNEGYAEEDIETIEEVRDFFLCYYHAQEYNAEFSPWGPHNSIVNDARELLRKYGQIRLEEEKFLTYNKDTRNIQIIQDAFILDTEYNVDVTSFYENYSYIGGIETEYGTWVKYDDGIPEFRLLLFGTVMETIVIKDISMELRMVDISDISSLSYQKDTKFYLFQKPISNSLQEYPDYYIYVIDENEWIPLNSIKEIKITNNYISFINSENVFYVYCIEHNTKNFVKVLEEDEELIWISEPVGVYIPESMEEDFELLNEVFEKHEKCSP